MKSSRLSVGDRRSGLRFVLGCVVIAATAINVSATTTLPASVTLEEVKLSAAGTTPSEQVETSSDSSGSVTDVFQEEAFEVPSTSDLAATEVPHQNPKEDFLLEKRLDGAPQEVQARRAGHFEEHSADEDAAVARRLSESEDSGAEASEAVLLVEENEKADAFPLPVPEVQYAEECEAEDCFSPHILSESAIGEAAKVALEDEIESKGSSFSDNQSGSNQRRLGETVLASDDSSAAAVLDPSPVSEEEVAQATGSEALEETLLQKQLSSEEATDDVMDLTSRSLADQDAVDDKPVSESFGESITDETDGDFHPNAYNMQTETNAGEMFFTGDPAHVEQKASGSNESSTDLCQSTPSGQQLRVERQSTTKENLQHDDESPESPIGAVPTEGDNKFVPKPAASGAVTTEPTNNAPQHTNGISPGNVLDAKATVPERRLAERKLSAEQPNSEVPETRWEKDESEAGQPTSSSDSTNAPRSVNDDLAETANYEGTPAQGRLRGTAKAQEENQSLSTPTEQTTDADPVLGPSIKLQKESVELDAGKPQSGEGPSRGRLNGSTEAPEQSEELGRVLSEDERTDAQSPRVEKENPKEYLLPEFHEEDENADEQNHTDTQL